MKKFLVTITAALALFITSLSPAIVAAATPVDVAPICSGTTDTERAAAGSDVCKEVKKQQRSGGNPIIDTIRTVINIISYAVGVASIIILIISGFRLILDGGDPQKVAQARSGIIYALVGIAVTVLAQSLVHFVLNRV